jgi:hypothetical protein
LQQIQLLIQPLGAEPNSGSCYLGQPFCAMMRSIDDRTLTGNGPTAVQSHPTKNRTRGSPISGVFPKVVNAPLGFDSFQSSCPCPWRLH